MLVLVFSPISAYAGTLQYLLSEGFDSKNAMRNGIRRVAIMASFSDYCYYNYSKLINDKDKNLPSSSLQEKKDFYDKLRYLKMSELLAVVEAGAKTEEAPEELKIFLDENGISVQDIIKVVNWRFAVANMEIAASSFRERNAQNDCDVYYDAEK